MIPSRASGEATGIEPEPSKMCIRGMAAMPTVHEHCLYGSGFTVSCASTLHGEA